MGKKLDILIFIILVINFPVVAVALYNQNWITVALNGGLMILLAISTTSPRVDKKEDSTKQVDKT